MSLLDSIFFGRQERVRMEARQRIIHNLRESYLYRLPTELLDQIAQLLPPLSTATLGVTCQLFSRYLVLTVSRVKHRELEILCMLERETDIIPLAKAVCSGCLVLHPCDCFPSFEVPKDPEQRCCHRTVKRLVVLPDHLFSLHDILRPEKTVTDGITSFISEPDGRTTLTQEINIMPVPERQQLSKAEITEFLEGFDMPICPHLRFSRVFGYFDTTYRLSGCPRFGFRQLYRCGKCKTIVWFTETATLNLHVERDLGHIARDPTLS